MSNTITAKQTSFIRDLLAKREGDKKAEAIRDALNVLRVEGVLSKETASKSIDALLEIKVAPKPASVSTAAVPAVPEGHYAVPSATGNNDYDFYRVDVPTDGKWAGYVFVKRVIGGRPDASVSRTERSATLERILDYGVEQAGKLYAAEIGRCRRCNRSLTAEDSRIGRDGYGAHCYDIAVGGA